MAISKPKGNGIQQACCNLLFIGCLLSAHADAQVVEIPNSFTAGTPALADEVNENFDALAAAVNDDVGRSTTTDVVLFMLPDGTFATPDVVGSAVLNRTVDGLNLSIETSSLEADTAYSVWWLVFNNPAACIDGCGEDDISIAEVEASLLNAAGRFVGATDSSTFAAFLPVGFMHTNSSSENPRQLFGPGLQNIDGAEIFVVIRNHGPASGNVEQISTFFGDCLNTASAEGCFDAQIAIFPPLGDG